MQNLVSAIQNDLLAVIVLFSLIFSAVLSSFFIFRSNIEITATRYFRILLALLPLLGLPVTLDLLQTTGLIKIFAYFELVILILNFILFVVIYQRKKTISNQAKWIVWTIPLLVAAGLVVAGYLTYVEATAHLVECGVAIPGCVSVQTSSYAKLFGFFPTALLGVIGYVIILAVWIVQKKVARSKQDLFSLILWGFCMFGVLFSIYLTYLEAFVIHATCSWCVLSAVIMVLLLMISTPNAQKYFFESDPAD